LVADRWLAEMIDGPSVREEGPVDGATAWFAGRSMGADQRVAPRAGHVGVTATDNRLFVDAVLYRYRAGIPWRDLPEHYGPWKVMHTRFTRWAKSGVWGAVFAHLASDADTEYAMIDSTIVRAHQHSAGAKGGIVNRRPSGAARAG
jgi:transposase